MTEPLKPSQVLSRAADLIEPEGAWIQGAFAGDGFGNTTAKDPLPARDAVCFCLFGAVNVASGCDPDVEESRADVEPFIVASLGLPETAPAREIVLWNDAPGRTQAEVVSALRKASKLAEDAGQ